MNDEKYIDSICINGQKYKIKASLIEAYPINCKNCGALFELKYGSGRCDYCGTYYTTEFKIVEKPFKEN